MEVDKPLLKMHELEFERAFDQVAEDISSDLIREALKNTSGVLTVAAVLLHLPGGPVRLVHWLPEYGDADGLNMVRDTARRLRRQKGALPKDSSLSVVTIELPWGGAKRTVVPEAKKFSARRKK